MKIKPREKMLGTKGRVSAGSPSSTGWARSVSACSGGSPPQRTPICTLDALIIGDEENTHSSGIPLPLEGHDHRLPFPQEIYACAHVCVCVCVCVCERERLEHIMCFCDKIKTALRDLLSTSSLLL